MCLDLQRTRHLVPDALRLALMVAQDRVDGMIQHLSGLAQERLIISFAPKTLAYSILKRIGELFPGPSKVCCSNQLSARECWSLP